MNTYQCDYELAGKLQSGINPLRIIILAMMLGAATFLGIAMTLRLSGTAGPIKTALSTLFVGW